MTNADKLTASVAALTDDQLIIGIRTIDEMATTEPHHRMVCAFMSDELGRRYPEANAIVSAMYDDEAYDHLSFLDMFDEAVHRLAAA